MSKFEIKCERNRDGNWNTEGCWFEFDEQRMFDDKKEASVARKALVVEYGEQGVRFAVFSTRTGQML